MHLPGGTPPEVDYSVRPSFRVLGVLLSCGVAALFAKQGLDLLPLSISPQASCSESSAKSQAVCKLGASMLSLVPESLHGPLLGFAHLAMAAILLLAAWLLLKPLFFKKRRKAVVGGPGS